MEEMFSSCFEKKSPQDPKEFSFLLLDVYDVHGKQSSRQLFISNFVNNLTVYRARCIYIDDALKSLANLNVSCRRRRRGIN